MRIDVSHGEVIDKMTILHIKMERIKDSTKLKYIEEEYDMLQEAIADEQRKLDKWMPIKLYDDLKEINEKLWDAEEILREKEAKQNYDWEFIKNAVLDSELNDLRFLKKSEINSFFKSGVREQKSYKHLNYEAE